MLNIVFPSLPYLRSIDPMWQEEQAEAVRCGYSTCLFDEEQDMLYGSLDAARPTLYRGWMLSEAAYQRLAAKASLLVSYVTYAASHLATGWYDAAQPWTPASLFCPAAEAPQRIAADGKRYFVKTLVKSFGPDSVVESGPQLAAVLRRHQIGSDEILMVREFITLSNARPEQRFFCVRGEAFGVSAVPFPAELRPVLEKLAARWFYTVDVAYTLDNQPIIIEVGDGQVSDVKEWPVAELYDTAISRLAETASVAH